MACIWWTIPNCPINSIYGSKENSWGDINSVVAWEDFLVSPLKVTPRWTTIIQQRNSSTYRHVWDICTWRHLKVSITEWAGERGWCSQWSHWLDSSGGSDYSTHLAGHKGAKVTFQPEWPIHIADKPSRENKVTYAWTCLPSAHLSLTHPRGTK